MKTKFEGQLLFQLRIIIYNVVNVLTSGSEIYCDSEL
jgi:hypothetical protein